LAGGEENVVIKAGDCSVTLAPAYGGKIGSLRIGNEELLQAPLRPMRPRTRTMAFSDGDASGWDECLPSVGECEIATEAGPIRIPDHGDLWRIPWQVLDASEDAATLRVDCFSLPLQLTRSILLAESPSGWSLRLLYSLTNMGAYRVPWSWSAHPLFAVDAGDRIVLPENVQSLRVEGSAGARLGPGDSQVSWPSAKTGDGTVTDLSIAAGAASGIGDKLFAGGFTSAQDGWCALERVRLAIRLTVRFEPTLTPYLGLWLCYGGWPDGPGKKQVCVAPEPATSPVDSLAKMGAWSRCLEAGETFTWPLELQIDRIATESKDRGGRGST